MEIVVKCASTAPSHLRSYMLTMASLDNIPRKEKQFVNFTSNSLKLRGSDKKIVEQIWSCLRQEREKRLAEKDMLQQPKQQQQQQQQQQKEQIDENCNREEEKKADTNGSTSNLSIDAKTVKKITKKTLKKAPNRSMRIKELRKILGKELGLPKSAKKRLKKLLLETAKASNDKIKVNGKIMYLH